MLNYTSPIDKIVVDGRKFYVKRDDLIDQHLAGNKYRKLYTLLKTPANRFNKIISYGGTQSNAMLAIASMCHKKGWEFYYYTKPLSKVQKQNPSGNYHYALQLGMNHIELPLDEYKNFITSLRFNLDEKTFIIDQGGAVNEADEGLKVLAQELRDANTACKTLATPSGTGTTALFLAKNLPEYKVYTTPAIGDVEYLKTQMKALGDIPSNLEILQPPKKYHFAKLYPEFYEIYKKLLKNGVEFDLLYAPAMWLRLLELPKDEEVIYIHSGGVSGNETMLKRYIDKFYS